MINYIRFQSQSNVEIIVEMKIKPPHKKCFLLLRGLKLDNRKSKSKLLRVCFLSMGGFLKKSTKLIIIRLYLTAKTTESVA